MSRVVTFEEVAQRYADKFEGKTLLSYSSSKEPCRILCPIHGEQVSKSFTSIINSKHGCPACGQEATNKAAKVVMTNYHSKNKGVKEAFKAAKEAVGTQNVESVIAAGMAALNAAKNGQLPFESNLTLNTATLVPWSQPQDLDQDEFVFVPFYKDVALAAGGGSLNTEGAHPFRLPFGRATLRNKGVQFDKVVCCKVDGDSMEPRLSDGATVGVDTGDTSVRDGKIYAINQGGLTRVKILIRETNNQLRIRSYNNGYPDEVVPAESLEVIGRVFWISDLV